MRGRVVHGNVLSCKHPASMQFGRPSLTSGTAGTSLSLDALPKLLSRLCYYKSLQISLCSASLCRCCRHCCCITPGVHCLAGKLWLPMWTSLACRCCCGRCRCGLRCNCASVAAVTTCMQPSQITASMSYELHLHVGAAATGWHKPAYC